MIYALVGTHKDTREKAHKELSFLGSVAAHVYSEHIAALPSFIEAQNIFGEKVIVHVIQTMDKAESREVVIELLDEMKASPNIFIIDEPFADANRIKRLEKYAHKFFNAKEEKVKDVDPFALCNAFERRDKKTAWTEWMNIRGKESGEAIAGALWWKMRTIWEATKQGKATKFTERECEIFASRLVRAMPEAHRGNKDLSVELESIILSV